jgi:hypothetical protein
MIQPQVWRTIGESVRNAWAAIGPLVGVLIGAYLAKRWQRDQWIADNKRMEYRKLLTTLTKTFSGIVKLRVSGVALGAKEQRTLSSLEAQSIVVIRDRMFIAKEVTGMSLLARWNQALRDHDNTLDADAFAKAFGLIVADLQKSATGIIK